MTNRWDPMAFGPGRWAGPRNDASLRASDAERNEVSDRLSRHFAEGRLDQTEFKARLDQAMGATTRGDLQGLFDDLPRLDSPAAETRPRRHRLLGLLVAVVVVASVASWSFSVVHVPWVLVGVIGLFLWFRVGHHHHHDRKAELGP